MQGNGGTEGLSYNILRRDVQSIWHIEMYTRHTLLELSGKVRCKVLGRETTINKIQPQIRNLSVRMPWRALSS